MSASAVPAHRRIVCDYVRQWTPMLLQQLAKAGMKVAELPDDEEQRAVWDGFAGNRHDTLLLSELPVPTFSS